MSHRVRVAARLRGSATAFALTLIGSVAMSATPAHAVVVDMNQTAGAPAQPYGVAVPAGTQGALASAGVSVVSSGGSCADPEPGYFNWADFTESGYGLCWHGGSLLHGNETFALTWDPSRSYWATTRNYMEQYLHDVAASSGSAASPYALTTQYTDGSVDSVTHTIGRAGNQSMFGGGCIDFGSLSRPTCNFASSVTPSLGTDYPTTQAAGACVPASGYQYCVTDAAIRQEVSSLDSVFAGGVHKPDFTPVVVVMLPKNVEACLDDTGRLCSQGSGTTAQFCSYHSHFTAGGGDLPYVVQPWTAHTSCDEPNLPALPSTPSETQVAIDAGTRMVSPLSQGQIAAIVNPDLNGWYTNDGWEINDGSALIPASPSAYHMACVPGGPEVDTVSLAGDSYVLQREFNTTSTIETDPYAEPCNDQVTLAPTFVVPSPINPGDVVAFDGSTTPSTLFVPKSDYIWSFGDGTSAVGPSPVHVFAANGTYTVTLTVIDRGANVARASIPVVVGTGVSAPAPSGGGTGTGTGTGATGTGLVLHMHLHATPLAKMLRNGLQIAVSANQRADGIISLTIPRASADRAHLATGRGGPIVIGRGTLSGLIKSGTVTLHVHLARGVAAKLARLAHIKVTVTLSLAGAHSRRVFVAAATY